jgi:hypothetical protein
MGVTWFPKCGPAHQEVGTAVPPTLVVALEPHTAELSVGQLREALPPKCGFLNFQNVGTAGEG